MIHLALLAIMGFQTGEPYYFNSKDGSVAITDITTMTGFDVNKKTGEFKAAGTGDPARIMMNAEGLAITAHSVAGAGAQTATETYLTEAHTSGDTKVVMDSSVAKAFLLKSGKAAKTPNGQGPYRMEFDTDRSDYFGSESEGKLTIPGPFELHGHSEMSKDDDDMKRPVHTRSVQELQMHGTSGVLNLDPRPGIGVRTIKDGVFEGPITFSGQREVTDLQNHKHTVSKLQNGRCDRVRILTDDKGETVVLEGHVSFDLDDETGTMHVPNAESVQFLFDPDLNPISTDANKIEMTVPIKG